jgi:hypothetical protein
MSNNVGGLLTSGGVPATGPQTALNQYTMGQGEVANAATFGTHGMGMSTNETAGAAGPEAGFALGQGEASLADTAAQQASINSAFKNFAGGLGGIAGKLG